MTGTREYSSNPSRRDVVGAGGALLGANFLSSPANAALAQLKLPDKAPETPPAGYNILFVLVDQEHFFEKWPFPVLGREYLKKNGTIFLNHQGASQVCSSARSVIYTGQHIQHTGVFDNMEAPWQRDMSIEMVTIGHRLRNSVITPPIRASSISAALSIQRTSRSTRRCSNTVTRSKSTDLRISSDLVT